MGRNCAPRLPRRVAVIAPDAHAYSSLHNDTASPTTNLTAVLHVDSRERRPINGNANGTMQCSPREETEPRFHFPRLVEHPRLWLPLNIPRRRCLAECPRHDGAPTVTLLGTGRALSVREARAGRSWTPQTPKPFLLPQKSWTTRKLTLLRPQRTFRVAKPNAPCFESRLHHLRLL